MLNNIDIFKSNFGKYDNWSLLGRGTFSVVYTLREKQTGRLLACKVMESRELAEREKDFLQKASHPLFPRFERFEKLELRQEYFAIFMEYIPGITLKELVERRGALTEKQVARLGCELAEGLLFLHEQRLPIIYRDLKPENVLIQQDGRVRLIDLGCACYVEERKNTRAGTRGYAAPEQLEGDGQADVESDVYALGKLLQFALGAKYESKRRVTHAFLEILDDMTRQDRRRRVPDMRIFFQRMDKFTAAEKKQGTKKAKNAKSARGLFPKHKRRGRNQKRKGPLKRIRSIKRVRNMQFYYQKNIRRGT